MIRSPPHPRDYRGWDPLLAAGHVHRLHRSRRPGPGDPPPAPAGDAAHRGLAQVIRNTVDIYFLFWHYMYGSNSDDYC